jgi:hypothetical protein
MIKPSRFEVQDGTLRIEHRGVLTPVSDHVFSLGEDGPRAEFGFAGNVMRLRLGTEVDEGNYYERVERWNPMPMCLLFDHGRG